MNQVRNRFAASTVAAGFALLFTGCASIDSMRGNPLSSHKAPVDHATVTPVLPAAGSGKGAYYQDDGPGAHPPPLLDLVPDAVFKPEPLAKFGNRPYAVFDATYTPLVGDAAYSQQGVASWYGNKFHGRRTASGERYDMYKMTAAHPTLPIPSYVRITNLDTGTHVIVRINDRGPFHSSRLIDVSYTAALKLGMLKKGNQHVQIDRILAPDLDSKLQ
jgi:rare lipoprotein A